MQQLGFIRIPCLVFLLCFGEAATSQNLVPNSDFDAGTTGWSGGTLFASDGFPSMPSYLVTAPHGYETVARSDCFSIDTTKKYIFSGEVRVTSENSLNTTAGILAIELFKDPSCASNSIFATYGGGLIYGDNWNEQSYPPPFGIPYIVVAAKIELVAWSGDCCAAATVLFDHIRFEPDKVFSSGFE